MSKTLSLILKTQTGPCHCDASSNFYGFFEVASKESAKSIKLPEFVTLRRANWNKWSRRWHGELVCSIEDLYKAPYLERQALRESMAHVEWFFDNAAKEFLGRDPQ